MSDETPDTGRYIVVINHEEQYSIWPDDGRDIPHGWSAVGKRGTRQQCLDHIEEVWTDMRPKSVRERMEAAGDDG